MTTWLRCLLRWGAYIDATDTQFILMWWNYILTKILTDTQTEPTTYNAWEEDLATLNIFFRQETVMGETFMNLLIQKRKEIMLFPQELERGISMGPVEFVSSLGGLFGLFLGFSVVSFIEIIYWVTLRICRNCIWKPNAWALVEYFKISMWFENENVFSCVL